jgi:hypothetical protein
LLRYFKGTIHFRQVYSASQPPKLVGYADADHANDEDDRKSFLGYCFFLSDKSAAARQRVPRASRNHDNHNAEILTNLRSGR